jgi:hypothetical protein
MVYGNDFLILGRHTLIWNYFALEGSERLPNLPISIGRLFPFEAFWKTLLALSGSANPEIAIIGAGPCGLSIAAHLWQRGIALRIFGIPMQNCRNAMPRNMFLKSKVRAPIFPIPNLP